MSIKMRIFRSELTEKIINKKESNQNIYKIVYVNTNFNSEDSVVFTTGITLDEFYESLTKKPNHIMPTVDNYCMKDSEYSFHVRRSYFTGKVIDEVLEEYSFDSVGDFGWIDFDDVEHLKDLTANEIAEIYYISNQFNPINRYYFNKIDNQFFYLTHDDGWFSQVWYKNMSDFYDMFANVISNKLSILYDLVPPPCDRDTVIKLCNLNENGISLNFNKLEIDRENSILIPIYCIDKFGNIDDMYRKVDDGKIEPTYNLKYKNKWSLEAR